jgi:hypothetical protein
MKTIFNDSDFAALLGRLEALKPDAVHQWGKMDVAQMLAHTTIGIEVALGTVEVPSKSNLFFRWIVKPIAVGRIPIKKHSPTAPEFRMTDTKEFAVEKSRLIERLRAAKTNGLAGEWRPHVAFGPLTADEWGRLLHKHLDHHLQQFGA